MVARSRGAFAPEVCCRLPPHEENARAWSAERRNHEPPPYGGRALCVSRASPSGAPRVAFLSPGPRFLVSVPAPVAVLEAPAQRLTRLANRAGTIGAVPVQRSSSRSGRSAARAGPRGLPSAGVRTPPAGATPPPRPASVLQDAPRVGEVECRYISLGLKSRASAKILIAPTAVF